MASLPSVDIAAQSQGLWAATALLNSLEPEHSLSTLELRKQFAELSRLLYYRWPNWEHDLKRILERQFEGKRIGECSM